MVQVNQYITVYHCPRTKDCAKRPQTHLRILLPWSAS